MTSLRQEMVPDHWNSRAESYPFNITKDFDQVIANWRTVLDADCGPAVLTRLLQNP